MPLTVSRARSIYATGASDQIRRRLEPILSAALPRSVISMTITPAPCRTLLVNFGSEHNRGRRSEPARTRDSTVP